MDRKLRDDSILGMREYFAAATAKAEERTAHTLEVLENAERILEGERTGSDFVKDVAVLAALFHDIGIPEAERKHGSTEPKYQHEEGPPITRLILAKLHVRPDILERVCFIVGNHHTKSRIDNVDFQIVYEADYIVNTVAAIAEGLETDPDTLRRRSEEHLLTTTARRLMEDELRRSFDG